MKNLTKLEVGYVTEEERLHEISQWTDSGAEHDFHEMNLVRRLEKAKKMDDFRHNYLPKLAEVVEEIREFHTNCWEVKTKSGRVFLYYSTSGKTKEKGKNKKTFKVDYRGCVKFFSKPEFAGVPDENKEKLPDAFIKKSNIWYIDESTGKFWHIDNIKKRFLI